MDTQTRSCLSTRHHMMVLNHQATIHFGISMPKWEVVPRIISQIQVRTMPAQPMDFADILGRIPCLLDSKVLYQQEGVPQDDLSKITGRKDSLAHIDVRLTQRSITTQWRMEYMRSHPPLPYRTP